jgi:hypothetical protein
MPVDFSTQIHSHTYEVFARPITVTPIKSQPNQSAYSARGIYGTVPIDVVAEDGSIISDARTIIDLREIEFSTIPIQGDQITIPASGNLPALGSFEILDTDTNGGGETTATLRKVMVARP